MAERMKVKNAIEIPKYRLGWQQHGLLCEALRRRTRFLVSPSGGNSITDQWTGLGYASEYEPVCPRYMTQATSSRPRCMRWWRLTPEGAVIVQYWIDLGYTHENIERGDSPPAESKV